MQLTLLAPLFCLLTLFLAGCSYLPDPTQLLQTAGLTGGGNNVAKANQADLQEHKTQARQYLALADKAPESLVYEYQLRAADQHVKAGEFQEAKLMIRKIHNTTPHLDEQNQSNLLEARLALLQQDSRRAQLMINNLLAPFAQNPHLIANAGMPQGQKIALLLPCQGQHAAAAKTIRDGFLAAYYKSLQRTPADPRVQVYDTGQGENVTQAYQQALADKADFIVGPLTKPEVQAIAGIKLDVPVLALNTIPNSNRNPSPKKSAQSKSQSQSHQANLYQFGLMPEDEIASTIENANRRGHKRALIIAPNNEWGQRMTSTFQKIWSHKGKEVTRVIAISPQQDMAELMQTALQDASKSGKNPDMIFLVASPELARQLTPLIHHYQKNQIPVYATSSVYSGKPAPKLDHDLDGIHFCDMPWVINQSLAQQENKSLLSDLWSENPSNPRYFALGIDAYQLAAQLAQTGMPVSGSAGMTGFLHKDGQRIQRQLVCAKFAGGVPVPD